MKLFSYIKQIVSGAIGHGIGTGVLVGIAEEVEPAALAALVGVVVGAGLVWIVLDRKRRGLD